MRITMSKLESITIRTSDERYEIKAVILSVKNYSGVIRKLKQQNVIAIIKIDDGKYMAFIEE
jgi:hypothetical protein|tara:strand:+ start:309 stop:494 length:186 start_codon:yes stop_codon:yes gene_type:complete